MFVSIDLVVVNYKTPDDLNAFTRSLEEFPPRTECSLRVIDVEAGPYRRITKWAGGDAHLYGLPDNVGYAGACNFGAALGQGEIIAFFNADVVLTKDAVDRCYEAMVANPDWAILGPCQVDFSNRIRHAGIFGTLAAPAHRGWNEINNGQYEDVRDAVSVSGSAYFVRRDVWKQLTDCALFRDVAPNAQGAFLPTRHYYEESWCSVHAHAHGHRVMYYGFVTIVHKWHQASTIGGWAEQQMPISHEYFRQACDHHGLEHD